MTKTEFLQQLYNNLLPLTSEERKEIIQDFEEHFSIGLESGKSEEQICAELGSPESCAASYLQGISVGNQYQTSGASNSSANGPSNKTVAYTVPVPPKTAQTNPNERVNRFLWAIMFLFFVICAFVVYPTAISLMLSPIIIAILTVVVLAFSWTGFAVAFLICLSVALFSAGLLIFLVMTELLRLSFKKAGF